MTQYYADRAGAGLIITEGTAPSPDGLGYARIPGAYSEAQMAGWKQVTDAVHAAGGKIFLQIMHTGRVAHTHNMPQGAKMIAPSAIAAAGEMWTDAAGMLPHPEPEEIAEANIPALIAEFVHSATVSIEAGFDGVEIHAANGYLPMQFLNPGSNQRTDKWGGSPENRNRFVLELAREIAAAIGADKTGIRLSPGNPFNDMAQHEDAAEQYGMLAAGLQEIGLVYIHLLGGRQMSVETSPLKEIKAAFQGTFILNAGYDAASAETDIASGKADLISFGSSYIANPDLAARFREDVALAAPDQSTFYTPGNEGYNTYPKATAGGA
jgi:N-ethylmaleimide reductase